MQNPDVGWLAAIIIGGIAGWLAEMFMKSNMGVLMNIILETVGAIVANLILSVGACILIAVARAIKTLIRACCTDVQPEPSPDEGSVPQLCSPPLERRRAVPRRRQGHGSKTLLAHLYPAN